MQTVLPKMDLANSPTGCCPVFEPESWDGKTFDLSSLQFISAQTKSFFYIPLNMGKVMSSAQQAIAEAKAADPDRYLMLSEDVSKWKTAHNIMVTGKVPGYDAVTIQGDWMAKVFEGSYANTGEWYRDMEKTLGEKGLQSSRIMAFYTTCPKCAKTYGKNYVVLFAKVA